MVPVASVQEVYHYGALIRCREGVAVDGAALCGRHFRDNAVSGERDAVISGLCDLPAPVGERPETGGRIVLPASGIGKVLADHRHDGNVQKVAAACTAQVGMRKPDYRRIGFVIAGAPVPALGDVGGPCLDESEGNVGTHEYVAVESRSDQRVDKVCRFLLRAGADCQYGEYQIDIFHVMRFYLLAGSIMTEGLGICSSKALKLFPPERLAVFAGADPFSTVYNMVSFSSPSWKPSRGSSVTSRSGVNPSGMQGVLP